VFKRWTKGIIGTAHIAGGTRHLQSICAFVEPPGDFSMAIPQPQLHQALVPEKARQLL
jgi:hypothetical protein